MARIATSGGILSKDDGTNYKVVPYRGAAPVIQDLLAGQFAPRAGMYATRATDSMPATYIVTV